MNPERSKKICTKQIKVSDIKIGERARVDLGDIESLAVSIMMQGLLCPIIVTVGNNNKYELVDGERRLKAVKSLGMSTIEATLLEELTKSKRKELEIIMCLQRKQLHYAEEARVTKQLVEQRKREAQLGIPTKFGDTIKNKDVAVELNLSESRMSENLRIADALEDHPELEVECNHRAECLRRIRKQEFYIPQGGVLQSVYEENFIVQTPLGCLDTIGQKAIDLVILHSDNPDKELLIACNKKLKTNGQIIVFCEHIQISEWSKILFEEKFIVGSKPYIWNQKTEAEYQMYLWAGKKVSSPIRAIPFMINADKPKQALSNKAKPFQLMNIIIKCCTERGGFVVVPNCQDIQTIKVCVESSRNIRAACANKIMRDKLILSIVESN